MCVQHPRKGVGERGTHKIDSWSFSLPFFSIFFCFSDFFFFVFGYPLFQQGVPGLLLFVLFVRFSIFQIDSVLPAQGHKKLRKTCTTPERSGGETSHILSRWNRNLLGLVRSPQIPDTLGIEPESLNNKTQLENEFQLNSVRDEEGVVEGKPTGYAHRFVIWALNTYETMIMPMIMALLFRWPCPPIHWPINDNSEPRWKLG